MHPEARAYVAAQVAALGPFPTVLEIGSRDINGGVRDLFGDTDYIGLDVTEGPGVDVVADAVTYQGPKVACVVCCEVLEHTRDADAIVANAYQNLAAGGVLIVTAATDPRAPHSAVDGGEVREGEYYANVDPDDLREWLRPFKTVTVDVDLTCGDVRAVAVKRKR